MRKPCSALLASAFLTPLSSVAFAATPPLDVPAAPGAPPEQPMEGAPPVLDLSLPERPDLPDLDLPGLPPNPAPWLEGPPVEGPPPGLPSLEGVVVLPDGALNVLELAPPFGAPLPSRAPHIVPEPGSAALMLTGLLGLAGWRNARRRG